VHRQSRREAAGWRRRGGAPGIGAAHGRWPAAGPTSSTRPSWASARKT
jgi:hypothetical protein